MEECSVCGHIDEVMVRSDFSNAKVCSMQCEIDNEIRAKSHPDLHGKLKAKRIMELERKWD